MRCPVVRRPVLAATLSIVLALMLPPGDTIAASYRTYFEFLSPRPGAEYVQEGAAIILRPTSGTRTEVHPSIQVTGETSGVHSGHWVLADDRVTHIFKPDNPFAGGERVSVAIARDPAVSTGLRVQEAAPTYRFSFTTSKSTGQPHPPEPELEGYEGQPKPAPSGMRSITPRTAQIYPGIPLPMDFPAFTVQTLKQPAEGYVFLATMAGFRPYNPYLIILDNSGTPVFFRKGRTGFYDFKRQIDGTLTYAERGGLAGQFFVMDDTYAITDTWGTQGYRCDIHELQVLPSGHALVQSYDWQIVDMSAIVPGGSGRAWVIGLIIQELDASNNVVFQWRSWDHIPITDTYEPLTAGLIDYVHGNALELDHDGNILSSQRNLCNVVKIDRATGDIIWRLGGKSNDFTLAGDTQWFQRQHDCRRLPNGHLTLFDNGNTNTPEESRYVEYSLDEEAMVATFVREIRHEPALFSPFMGNAQRLPNGNVFISWGSRPWMTEVSPGGEVVFELAFPSARGERTYRGFRYEWDPGPAARPELWHRTDNDALTLYFTRFQDDDVRTFKVYRHQRFATAEHVATTSHNSMVVHNYEPGSPVYFQVTATDDQGTETPYSNEILVTPEFGDNTGVLSAMVEVNPRTINLKARRQCIYALVRLPAGDYDPSDMDAELCRLNGLPASSLSMSDQEENTLVVEFSMEGVAAILEEGRDVEVSISGRVGDIPFEGLDHVRVMNARTPAPSTALAQNLPNPVRLSTRFDFSIPKPGRVRIEVFDVTGRRMRVLIDEERGAGSHSVTWDGMTDAGRLAPSGMYFYRLTSGEQTLTKKLLVMR